MSVNLTTIKNTLGRKFRGANLDDVQGISDYSLFGEAASNLLSKIDPYETVRHGEVDLFQDINDYSAPSDLKGKKIIDIRRQVRRQDDFRQTLTEDFDRDKEEETFTVEFDEGTKFMRIERNVSNSTAVTSVNVADFTAGTGVSNITADTILLLGESDGQSLRFDVSSGSNLLTWTGTAVDLTTHKLKASLFLEVYWPDSSIISSIAIRIGSDSSNYFSITGTLHRGTVRNGVNLYRFDWNGATETGTVAITGIDYVRLSITTTSADTDIRIARLYSKLPTPYESVYYSNSIFTNSAGTAFKTIPTADGDLMLLEKEAENIFIYECCVLISEGLQRDEDAKKFFNHLHGDGQKTGLYDHYKEDKPTEKMRPQTRYYRINRSSNPRIR